MSLDLNMELREVIAQQTLGLTTRYYSTVRVPLTGGSGLLLEDDDPPPIEPEPKFI